MTASETYGPGFFDEIVDRKQSNSVKWIGGRFALAPDEFAADPLPMWVADTDFRSPNEVVAALHEAVDHGVFGYPAGATPDYLEAIAGWQKKRFGWDIEREWIVQTAGVGTQIKTAVQAFTEPGDSVLIQPPVYPQFAAYVTSNGRRIAEAPLELTESGYRFDAEVFEAAIRPDTKLFILSHPHNPTGNVWTEAELRAMGEICLRHGVLVLSDEIHEDLVFNRARRHVPFASLSDEFAQHSITGTAPSKTFNLPGLQSANVFIPNERIRADFSRQLGRNQTSFVNVLGMVAAEAAYARGEAWLEAQLDYIRANHEHFAARVAAEVPGVAVLPTDSLYLAWMDCRGLGLDVAALDTFMLTQARLWLNSGWKFGAQGAGYMRVNLGCPRSVVDEAVDRLAAAVGGLGAQPGA